MAEILLLEADPVLRTVERTVLQCSGYTVLESQTADAALGFLEATKATHVIICGNADPGYCRLVLPFFVQAVQLEGRESAPRSSLRHRYICLTTVPEQGPPELTAIFQRLQVTVLKKPFYPNELLTAVITATAQLANQ